MMFSKHCWLVAVIVVCGYVSIGRCQNVSYAHSNDELAALQQLELINVAYWQSVEAYRKFSDDTLSAEILLRQKLQPYYEALQKYDWQNFKDPLLRRQFEVILRGAVHPPIGYDFKRATRTLKSMSRQKWACPRNGGGKCNLAFVHNIKTIFTNSDDLDEIKYYWQEWRNKLPDSVKEALHYYIGYYQNLSTPTRNASSVWYAEYEDANFMAELESLMDSIQPFYRELHAHMRHVLRVKYGDSVIPPTGLIPHHLLEQVTYQAWKKDSVLRNPFPQRKLPNLQAELDDVGLLPFDLVNISARFFSSIGFENLTDAFLDEHFKAMEPGSGGPDCKSRIFDFGTIEMHYCPKVYYKKLLQTHGDMARVQYALAKNNLAVGLNQEASPGFGNAIGEAVILSASTPKHLQQRLRLLQDYEYDDLLNLNRLYRMAVHTLLTIPVYFVHEKLWVDMIDGRVTPSEYNCHYWNLMQKYMGVEAPAQTNTAAYDMPYKFYEGIVDEYRSTRKIFGEFLGYQIYRAVCLITREFERGNAYKTLDNCDFANNRHAGKLLKEIMVSGSIKPWRDVIKPLTTVQLTRISATSFLEYFDTLNQWLTEDNLSKQLRVGWMESDKCKGNAVPLNITAANAY
ncbi:angiotensin-converting enzyme-like [Scaptodrosophila lebanonensis]|uniref:Angiotensin-converting enzyme n=1 Tax=Drosophila lebanonensis TaxID=7225 RepID=A0A6J2U2B1_DROLE|nr:angiotensin-converting enzyme-like [Scaptodrosophila lebanonensis]